MKVLTNKDLKQTIKSKKTKYIEFIKHELCEHLIYDDRFYGNDHIPCNVSKQAKQQLPVISTVRIYLGIFEHLISEHLI
jgi:hypothetical protein